MAPSGLYARLCHAFSSFIFLMISWRQIILGSAGMIFGMIFAIFSQMKAFWVQTIDLNLSDISRDVAMATNFVKKMANSSFWH